jgi:hypothetical protein
MLASCGPIGHSSPPISDTHPNQKMGNELLDLIERHWRSVPRSDETKNQFILENQNLPFAEMKALCRYFGAFLPFLIPIISQPLREKPFNEARLRIEAQT